VNRLEEIFMRLIEKGSGNGLVTPAAAVVRATGGAAR
jgi:hypothetical protein